MSREFRIIHYPFRRPESPGQRELQGVYDDSAGFYRAWHISEGSERSVIDFNLTSRPLPTFEIAQGLIISPPTPKEKKQRVQTLESLLGRTESLAIPAKESANHQYLVAKLRASLAYARRLAGEKMDPFGHIQETMGVNPQEIPEEILLAQREKVVALSEASGCPRYDKASLENFYRGRLISPEAMVGKIKGHGTQALSFVGRFIGQEIKVDYDAEISDEDAYWFNWVDGTANRFRLRVNKHKRHWEKFTDGKGQAMGLHEIATHLGMMQQRAKLIREGELPEVFGLTTVHEPEQVLLEGLAQTLHYFVPELDRSLTPEGRLAVELHGLRQMAYNNVQLQVISPDFTGSREQIRGIVTYIQRVYPAESRENILKEIRDRRSDPKLQAYRYAYGIGFLIHQRIAQGLSVTAKREFLRKVFSRPFTPTQEWDLYSNLRGNPPYRRRDIGTNIEEGHFLDVASLAAI